MSDSGRLIIELADPSIIDLKNTLRSFEGSIESYHIYGSDKSFSLKEIFKEIDSKPSAFLGGFKEGFLTNYNGVICEPKNLRPLDISFTDSYEKKFTRAIVVDFQKYKSDRAFNQKVINILFKVIPEIISLIEPTSAVLLTSEMSDYPMDGIFEYHKDLYKFLMVKEEDVTLLDKAPSLIKPSELYELIVKNRGDFKIIESKGIGLIKAKSDFWTSEEEKKFYVYPRYFIRKELKKRGLKIEDGLPEKYAKELGIK